MRDLTPLENELDNLKRHNSYLAFRKSHAVSSGEIAMLESAMKVNNDAIASISSEMIVEHLKKLCGVCGNEHSYSDAVCEQFVCLDCYSHFNQSEGTVTSNQGFSEFICNSCSTKSACGACGEWSQSAHNCSEEMK